VDQQHSARTGRQGPGQEPEQSRSKGRGPWRRGAKPRAAAAAAATGVPDASPAAPGSPQGAPRRGRGAGPHQESAALYRVQARHPFLPAAVSDAFSWLPRARLTALGAGLLAVLLMSLTGGLVGLLLDDSLSVYGTVFLLVSVACAAWVRPAQLFTAPVAVPLAYAAGLLFISGGAGNEGFRGHLVGLFPALAVTAVWLYAGTLAAVLVALVRKLALMAQRSRAGIGTGLEPAEEAGSH